MMKALLAGIAWLICSGLAGQIDLNAGEMGKLFLENPSRLYRLTGQWRFSRIDKPEFAEPEFNDSSWEWITVPGNWSVMGIHGVTVGWYRMQFRLSEDFQDLPLAVRVPAILDSHELFLNGSIIGKRGVIGPEGTIIKKNSLPGVYAVPEILINKTGWNVIALRVGDDVGWGGLETPDFLIGRAELVDLEFQKFVVWNSAVFIVLALLGLYFLFLYLFLSQEKSYLYFSLFSFCISLMLFGYYSFSYWLIDNFWFTHFCFETGVQIALVFGIHFVYSFYEYPSDGIKRLITVIGCLLMATLLLTPLHHSILRFYGNYTLNIALWFNATSFVYLLYLVIKSILLKKDGAKVIGLGILILMLSFLNDILGYLLTIENKRLGSEGTIVFMVCISFAMFFKYSRIRYYSKPR